MRRRMRSHWPVAVSVSGGLDSSSIFCQAETLRREGRISAPSLFGISYFGPAGGIINLIPIGANVVGTSQSLILTSTLVGTGPLQINGGGIGTASGGGTLVRAGNASAYDGPNQIYTVLLGDMIEPGEELEGYNHYSLLRTIEGIFGLGCLRNSCSAAPMSEFLP